MPLPSQACAGFMLPGPPTTSCDVLDDRYLLMLSKPQIAGRLNSRRDSANPPCGAEKGLRG